MPAQCPPEDPIPHTTTPAHPSSPPTLTGEFLGRRLGRFSSRVRHRGVPDRDRVPDRCNASGSAVDVCSDAPAGAQRAERAADGGVVDVSRPSLGCQVRRELMRSALLDLTPIIPTTACHQRNYVERYSKSIGKGDVVMVPNVLF